MPRSLIPIVFLIAIALGTYFLWPSKEKNPTVAGVQGVNSQNVSLPQAESTSENYGLTSQENRPAQSITNNTQQVQQSQKTKNMNITFHTTKGDINLELFADKAPTTVSNFIKLAQSGFYDGVKFHRVIKDFMIQGGDPLTKDDAQAARWGTGGPGYTFKDELYQGNSNMTGTIAMANAGPNTNGSQFFINTKDNNFLDTKHTVFGRVTAGMDVVQAIENSPVGSGDRPQEAIIINTISVQ